MAFTSNGALQRRDLSCDPDCTPPGREEGLDLVFIKGLMARTVVGVDDDERDVKQTVRIDLVVGVPHLLACATDRREDTVCYGEMRLAVLRLMATHRVRLLEALAERLARLAIGEFGARWVRVTIAKPQTFADVDSVGVQIERRAVLRQADDRSAGCDARDGLGGRGGD